MEDLLKTLKNLEHTLVGCMYVGNGQYIVLAKPIPDTNHGHAFVTWRYGSGGMYWGNYHQTFDEAREDFFGRCERSSTVAFS